jgi:flagellin-like hook-associated protein FlgL
MDVPSVTVGGIQSHKTNTAERNEHSRLRAVVDTIARAADKILPGQSTASRLQARETGFRQAANNLARVSALAQSAEDGVRQIRGEVEKLRSAGGDDVKKIRDNIDRVTTTTTFEGKKLLDGSHGKISLEETLSVGTGGSKNDVTLPLPDLTSRALVGAPTPERPAPEKIDQALRTVDTAAEQVRNFRRAADVVTVSLHTAAVNQQAAQAELQPKDFESTPLREIRENHKAAIDAQARISQAVVRLVN